MKKEYTPAEVEAMEEARRRALRRPQAWIKHDTSARRDPKLVKLVRRGGMAWYGMWWALVEALGEAEDRYLEVSTGEDWEIVADELCCSPDEAEKFVLTSVSLGLLYISNSDAEHRIITSERLLRDSDSYARRVAAASLGGKRGTRRN